MDFENVDWAAANLALDQARDELADALEKWPPMNSAHEGYGVLLEELKELEAHVFTNQKKRDLDAMRKEAIQVAAMAMRFAADICNEERGRK
jgi:hypothetical protein